MKNLILLLFLSSTFFFNCTNSKKMKPNYSSFEEYPNYDGDDLGYQYSIEKTTFKLWSPAADSVQIEFYEKDLEGEALNSFDLDYGEDGVWEITIKKNLLGKYYTYQAKFGNEWGKKSADPYSVSCGRNGLRTQILEVNKINPKGWAKDKRPPLASPNDIVIYEIQVRDMTQSKNSGAMFNGKYLSLAQIGTENPEGLSTGLDHIKEMGVTHVHIMPTFDFRSIDESLPQHLQKYNWGYDPHLYNVPEGSFSTNAEDGETRIREFKQMVMAFHKVGIRVILDVVYNHTGSKDDSVFDRLVPGYYFRSKEDGTKSNASACGNETASERIMVRNFILNSVKYWANEYHLDGFRFDLMGIHDIETMNLVSETLNKIDPSIFVYGEGWTAGESPFPKNKLALKENAKQLNQVAVFSDEIRDGLKGHVFTKEAKGFVSGNEGDEESVKFGIVGATNHPQLNFEKVNYSKKAWAKQPSQCINYVSCHDNNTLYDRLVNTNPNSSLQEKEKMGRLALAIVLTSQGVPFLHAGSEFFRTKGGIENSFESSDEVNAINWSRKNTFIKNVKFVKGLINIRKSHPAFKMKTQEEISTHLKFIKSTNNFIAYSINGSEVGDSWKKVLVLCNANPKPQDIELPKGNWKVIIENGEINENGHRLLKNNEFNIAEREFVLLIQE